MSQQWFVVRNGHETGPFTAKQLMEMANSGRIGPDDLVRRSDLATQKPAREVKGLFQQSAHTQALVVRPENQKLRALRAKRLVLALTGVILGATLLRFASFFLASGTIGSSHISDPSVVSTQIDNAEPGDTLTKEFYPFRPGMIQHTLCTNYLRDGLSLNARKEYKHTEQGTIEVRYINHFGMPGHINVPLPRTSKTTLSRERRIRRNWPGGRPWHSLGAYRQDRSKAGEEWEREVLPGVNQRYKLTKFGTREVSLKGDGSSVTVAVASLEVRHRFSLPSGNLFEHLEEITLGHGLGPVLRGMWVIEGAKRDRKWGEHLVPVLAGYPLPEQRAIYNSSPQPQRSELIRKPEVSKDTGQAKLPVPPKVPDQVKPEPSSTTKLKKQTPELTERLKGTRWVNTNKISFVWDDDGNFSHKGVRRSYEVIDDTKLRIDFGPGHIDTVVFDAELQNFDQFSTQQSNKPLFKGKRIK